MDWEVSLGKRRWSADSPSTHYPATDPGRAETLWPQYLSKQGLQGGHLSLSTEHQALHVGHSGGSTRNRRVGSRQSARSLFGPTSRCSTTSFPPGSAEAEMQVAPAQCSDVTIPRSEATALASRAGVLGGRRPANAWCPADAQLCSPNPGRTGWTAGASHDTPRVTSVKSTQKLPPGGNWLTSVAKGNYEI